MTPGPRTGGFRLTPSPILFDDPLANIFRASRCVGSPAEYNSPIRRRVAPRAWANMRERLFPRDVRNGPATRSGRSGVSHMKTFGTTSIATATFIPLLARGVRCPMKWAAAAAFSLLSAPGWPADYFWPVVRVIDGDTVKVDAGADMPPELASLSVRLRGVDTPEIGRRAKCDAERQAGLAATAFTEAMTAGADSVIVRDPAWGKWGGRVIADLIVNGRSLSSALVESGHGRPHEGSLRKAWCATDAGRF